MMYGIPCDPTGVLRGNSDRPTYKLTAPVSGHGITAPIGFVTDFVSAPDWLLPHLPLGKMARAAVIHDWLCNETTMSKGARNRIFRDLMKEDGVNFFVRWGAWAYVARPGAPVVHWEQPFLQAAS